MIKRTLAVVIGLVALTAPTAASAATDDAVAQGQHAQVQAIRHATTEFHNIATAEDAGYVAFKDVDGISCIDMPGMGGMGVHYVNPALIADPSIDPTKPEALVYAPDRDGTLRLAAVEFIVDKAAWDSSHAKGPELFKGNPFDVTKAPNRFGLDTFYSQHVWVWMPNSAGLLAMWNPDVNCAWA